MAERKKKVRTKGEPNADELEKEQENEQENEQEKGYNFNKDNAKAYGAKGGQISGEVRRRKKNMREMARVLLALPLTNKQTIDKMKELGIDAEDTTNQMAVLVRQLQAALVDGDTKAAAFLRDTAGYDNATMARMGFDTEDEDDDDLVIYIPDNGRQADVVPVPIESTGTIIDEPTKAGDNDGSKGD